MKIRDFKQKDTGDKYSTSSKKVLQNKYLLLIDYQYSKL